MEKAEIQNHTWLRNIGHFAAPMFALAHGVTVFSGMLNEPVGWSIFSSLCVAFINWTMSRKNAPEFMVKVFGGNRCFRNLIVNMDTPNEIGIIPHKERMSNIKLSMFIFGIVATCCTAIGAAALTYVATPESLSKLGLKNMPVAHIIALIFSVSSLIAYISMLSLAYSTLLKRESIKQDVKNYLKKIKSGDKEENSLIWRISLGTFIPVFFVLGFSGLYFETYPNFPSTIKVLKTYLHASQNSAYHSSLIVSLIIPLIAMFHGTE